ncbi:MAG: asparaginase [Flavobacteriales bacterium]|nr:asparaginase [Flavobacteriales bacterium]
MSADQPNKVLVIYTGGTIGMKEDPESKALIPLDFAQIKEHVPELDRFNFQIDAVTFDTPIDSSDVDVSTWVKLAEIIEDHYDSCTGFVVLHGTDTMAYTASALSFMLENLQKAVILTGSQLPIGKLRTDGKENLISAIEIAGADLDGESRVKEVAIYFGSHLMRGNRTHKYNTEDFEAIESANYPPLANVGTHIFFRSIGQLDRQGPFKVWKDLERNVAILKLFPGITEGFVRRVVQTPGLKGLLIESYGSGNAPNRKWLHDILKAAIDGGMRVVNVTQCNKGFVEQGRYLTSQGLASAGVIGSADMTTEAALTKVMYLLGKNLDAQQFETQYINSLCGELTNASKLV